MVLRIESCEFPDSLAYDVEAGTWAKEEATGFRVGISPQLSWISGGFTSMTFKEVGSRVLMGRSIGSAEGPRHFDVVRSPFDGILREVNPSLATTPRLANKDPFGQGWFAILEKTGSSTRLTSLPEAADSISEAIKSLGVHCFADFPDHEMFEIGVGCSAVLVKLDDQLSMSPPGTVVHLVSDDPTSDIEMARWADQTGNKVAESRREGTLHHFVVKKS